MVRRFSLALAVSLIALLPGPHATAEVGDPIDNTEQLVNGRGRRGGTEQSSPDISASFAVWQDFRGDADDATGNSLWSKNLGTRGEAPVTTLTTDTSRPRISGKWVVWADRKPGTTNDDIFARKLPAGKIVRVTKHPATQLNPAIDGDTVVWEDKRNGNVDIFKKKLGGTEKPVVVAPGDQTLPAISGQTVAWRDGRRGLTVADVYIRTGNNPEVEIARVSGAARSSSSHQVEISGVRLLWNELDPGECGSNCDPQILKTCVLPACTVATVDEVNGGVIHDIDVSGTQATWVKQATDGHVFTVDLSTCDGPPCDAPAQVDTSTGDLGVAQSRLDGQRFAWTQQTGPEGSDVFWRDFAIGEGPIRAHSLGLGSFAGHSRPAAEGDLVVYESGDIWATDLSPRRHFAVSTGLSTGTSGPRISGARTVWSENTPDTFSRVIDPLGSTTQLSDPGDGGAPDANGANTAWRCENGLGDPTDICVHNGTLITSYDVSPYLLDPTSAVGDLVRMSGDLVVWYEFWENGFDAQLHVLDTSPVTDTVIGAGVDVVGDVPDFDVSGSNVVWAGAANPDESMLWQNTATGSTGTVVAFEAPVNQHVVTSPSIDGTRVAWVDCPTLIEGGCDVYTRTLAESESHLVTNESKAEVRQPHVDGDRIFWIDSRFDSPCQAFCPGANDVFTESVTGGIIGSDTTAPDPPTSFTAGPNTGSVSLSWTNPPSSDFFRVRILRRTGTTAPKSAFDPRASVVYEDDGTSFVDEDVVIGKKYTYRAFAFDMEPNFSLPATDASG